MSDDPTFVDPVASSAPAADRFADLFALLHLFENRDAIQAAARELRELEIRIAVERENLADVKAERGDFDAKALMLDQAEGELQLRELEQNARFDDARQELVAHHRRLTEIESAIKFRLLQHAGVLAGFDPRLQNIPDWSVIDRLIGAPVDVVEEMRPSSMATTESWGGDQLTGGLTRSVSQDDLPTPKPPDLSAKSRRHLRRGAEAP